MYEKSIVEDIGREILDLGILGYLAPKFNKDQSHCVWKLFGIKHLIAKIRQKMNDLKKDKFFENDSVSIHNRHKYRWSPLSDTVSPANLPPLPSPRPTPSISPNRRKFVFPPVDAFHITVRIEQIVLIGVLYNMQFFSHA